MMAMRGGGNAVSIVRWREEGGIRSNERQVHRVRESKRGKGRVKKSERTDRRDNMLLAARGTAGQLLLRSVLVWRTAPRTVTLLCTHTHTHTHTHRNLLIHLHTQQHTNMHKVCVHMSKHIKKTRILFRFTKGHGIGCWRKCGGK